MLKWNTDSRKTKILKDLGSQPEMIMNNEQKFFSQMSNEKWPISLTSIFKICCLHELVTFGL